MTRKDTNQIEKRVPEDADLTTTSETASLEVTTGVTDHTDSITDEQSESARKSSLHDQTESKNDDESTDENRVKHVDLKMAATADSSIEQDELVSDSCKNGKKTNILIDFNVTSSNKTESFEMDDKEETNESIEVKTIEKEDGIVTNQSENHVQIDIPSKSDEQITVERQTSVHTPPKNYGNIIESKKQADDHTPEKNDLMTNYKRLMDEMLSLSCLSENDRFSACKSFGFDEFEKLSGKKQNGTKDTSDESVKFFTANLRKLPKNCISRRHLARSLPDDWTPGQSSKNKFESNVSNEERTLKRSYSDMDLSQSHDSYSDFDTRSVISDRGFQGKSRSEISEISERLDAKLLSTAECQKLFFTCNNGGEYRLAYPQLATRQKRAKPESCLLSYSEWKSKDNSPEIITQLNVPEPAKSRHVVIEEPKYDFLEKEHEKRCLICQKIFKTMEELRQHVINPCRPPEFRKVITEVKELDLETIYTCTLCNTSAKSEYAAKRHSEVCMQAYKPSDQRNYNMDTIFRCKMCGETFKYQKTACEHVILHSNSSPKMSVIDNSESTPVKMENFVKLSEETPLKHKTSPDKSKEKFVWDQVENEGKISELSIKPELQIKEMHEDVVTINSDDIPVDCHDDSINNELKQEKPVKNSKKDHKVIKEETMKKGKKRKKDKIEIEILLSGETRYTQDNKCKHRKIETEKDIDNESVKSFSTESSYMTIDASETSSIKSGEYKTRSYPPKHSVRLISKEIGKRVIKVKKFFGDQFEVPEFVETQVKKANLKRKFKPGNKSGFSISPKLRRALRKRELSNAKKKLKTSRQCRWNDNGVMKKHVKSREKKIPLHTTVEDSDNSKHPNVKKENILKVKQYPIENFSNKDITAFFEVLKCQKAGRSVFRCPISTCRSSVRDEKAMILHGVNMHKNIPYKTMKNQTFECKYCKEKRSCHDDIVKHSVDHYLKFVVDNIAHCSIKPIMFLSSLIEKKNFNCKTFKAVKSENKSESPSDYSKNNKKSGCESDRKASEKTPEDLCSHGNPKPKFTKTKIEKSVELCKRKLEINLGKRIKSEEVINRKPEFSGRKMKIIETPCNKSNVNKVKKKTPKHLVNEETVVQGLEKYKDTNLIQMNNVQASELDQASQRRSNRKQFSVEHKHFEESIKQKTVVSSHKKSKDKIVDIKSLSEKMDVSESEESEKTFDSFSSPDSSSLRRSCRKKFDSISAYKDFEMQNKKQSKSVDDDCDQTQTGKESDVKLETEDEDLEECNRRFSTRSNKRHNINSEVVSRKISNKSNVKRSVVKDRMDESEKLCLHNKRKRNHSLESDTSKTSDVKDIKLEDSEVACRRNVKKRHLSLDSNSSKTSVKSEKVNERCRSSSNNIVLVEKNVKKHKRKGADKEIMANQDPSTKQIFLSKSDEIDGLKKSTSQRNLRERKAVEPYKIVQKKINAGKKLESLSKTLHTVNNDIQEQSEELQNAFLDSFKKFVGISKKSITNEIKSLKQGKSSKLRAQAIMHRRKQSLRKSKVVNKIKPNAMRKENNMVEVVDLVEIKDFRNPNKNVSNEAGISSEIIDLTKDSERLTSEQENGAVKVENDNVKITSTLTKIEENTTSSNKKTSFLDSFLAHVNETESSGASIEKHIAPSSTKAVKNCTKVKKSRDNLLSDENNSTTPGLKNVEKIPDKNMTEQKNKDQLKCSTRKKTEDESCEQQSKESSETKLVLEGRHQNRRSQKKTTITEQQEDKTDVERPKEDDQKNKPGKNRISSKESDHEKKQTEDAKRSKSPDSSFQDSFMSYIDLSDAVPKEETTSLTNDSLNVEAENSLKLARKKSPFKWDLDDDDTEGETTTKAIKHSKPSPKNCTEKKSTSQINSNVQTVKVSKSSGSRFSKVSEIISGKNCDQKEKSFRNTRDECKSSDFKIVKRLRNSGHDTSSQNKDTKNTIKADLDQKMLPIKIQNTDFEKHFVKFLSTSSNKDVDMEGKFVEESQRSVESVILINDGNHPKMSGLEKRQKCTINVNNSDNKEASKASKTGENKQVYMETKSVVSKLDHSPIKSKQGKSVSSTLDKSVLISKQSFKGISSSKPYRNTTARYNLPTLQTKKINYSTKSFVYCKTPTDKKLIPISELKRGMNTTAELPKKVIDESKINSEETESSLKRNSELNDRIKMQVTNVAGKESDLSDKAMFQHKLIPTHRVRHMYHGGKVWQIGQGSVSAMNLASPTRPPHPNSKTNTAENVSHVQSDKQEQNETQHSENEHVKDAERNDTSMSDTSKDGEKHSRWKARKSPPKRPAPSDNNVHYGKRTRNTE